MAVPETLPAFHLTAPDLSPLAEAVAIALAIRGTALATGPASAAHDLTIRTAKDRETLTDGLLMLDRIEALHPDQPLYPRDADRLAGLRATQVMQAQALERLDRVAQVRDPQDLDLAIHGLRQVLRQLLRQAEALAIPARAPLTGGDLLLAPLVWRLLLLDGAFGLHLAIGFEALTARGQGLLARPEVASVLTPARAARILHRISRSGAAAAAARPDWSAALGPEARRKTFLPRVKEGNFHPLAAPLRWISDHR